MRGNDYCHYQPYIPPPPPISVGDIAYWDGSSVKTIPLSSWNSSLGTPVGVVMIGEGFVPNDGRARIIALKNFYTQWYSDFSGTNINTPKFSKVPTTDNAGSTTTGSSFDGYLPSDSDSFTGVTSFIDSKAKYYGDTPYIPSPYLGDAPNPAYYQAIEGGNVLSDFNGLSNTQTLVNAGSDYYAANTGWNYKDATNGADGLQWYLPAMGELGYLMPRFKQINESIQAVGGDPVVECMWASLWSSSITDTDDMFAARLSLKTGWVDPWGSFVSHDFVYAISCL